ncbi:hypothetical protein [Embleya sp. MST-111070]|uniref:hypothetical protein n=1 Tax=Embleya sp. MST-111070 TaxID=3398231 RepID=UPI003F735309
MISIQPTDDNGDAVEVGDETLYEKVLLVDFVDASLLSSDKNQQWHWVRDTKFKSIPGMTPQIKYLVYHNSMPDLRVRSFGVRVETSDGKYIYSSQNGAYRSSVLMEVGS